MPNRKIFIDKNNGDVLFAPLEPNPNYSQQSDYQEYYERSEYIKENGIPVCDESVKSKETVINAVIVDGWNLFGYNGPNKEPSEPNVKLVASKYLNHDWEIYIDFYAAHDSRFKIYKDGKEFNSQPRLSQCMVLADDCEEYE